MQKKVLGSGVLMLVIALVFLFSGKTQDTSASAPSGLPATVATSSIASVGTTAISLFATSTCSARIISTQAQAIMLTFSDYAGQTPTATFGHWQAASTTQAYDSGQYGCGLVKAYSFATQTITVTESR